MIEQLRELNALLALCAGFGLGIRTPAALAGVASKGVYLTLVVFPILVGFGSIQAVVQHAPGGPVTPCFTVAYLVLGGFLIWWPEQLNGHTPTKQQ